MKNNRGVRSLVGGLLLLVAGCGGGAVVTAPTEASYTPEPLVVTDFLLAYGREHADVLVAPEGDLEALNLARREAGNAGERRSAFRDIAVYHLLASLAIEDDEPARIRELRKAESGSVKALRGNRDETFGAEVEYLKIWISWQAGRPNAAARANRFTDRRTDAGELYTLAWLLGAEIAFEGENWEEALAGYRYLLGHLGHPLYGYALYRSGIAHRNASELEEAAQAFTEARDLGCAPSAGPEIIRMAALAAVELDESVHLDADGTPRPAACAHQEPVAIGGGDEPPPINLE